MSSEDLPLQYLRLALSIDQHLPGYVDAYYGPDDVAQSIREGRKSELADLQLLADQLAAGIASEQWLEPARREYLHCEVRAMQMTLCILRGKPLPIIEEAGQLYGVTPAWVDEGRFADAHHVLATILPGTGPLSGRVQAFREKMRVPVQLAAPAIIKLGADLRERALARFALPPQESCSFVFVREKPWAAYNWYLGARNSRIEFNADYPIYVDGLPFDVAHEAYPGHHTEHAIKEELLYRKEGRLEHAILVSNTPSALVSEGIAMNALDIVEEPEEIVAIYCDLLRTVGLPVEEAPRVHEFAQAARPLARVEDNQLLLLHGENAPEEEVIAYGMRHALTTEDTERRYMHFRKDPLWRSYGFNYTIGRELVEGFLASSTDRVGAFARLLAEPVTPGQLTATAARGADFLSD